MSEGSSPARNLRARGLAPKKSLGQNFLRDRSYLARILAAAEIGPGDDVLEIGAGTGILTEALAGQARRVVAIELDDGLYGMLSEQFQGASQVTIWHGDALTFDPCAHFEGRYKLIANIPYYITGPLLRRFLEADCPPHLLVLMVQREVAERMAAAPPHLSLLGVSVQYYAGVKIVARVPAGAFYPVPRVDSAIVRLAPHRRATHDPAQQAFFAVARAGFGTRRKQLINALGHGLAIPREAAASLLDCAGVEAGRRAETLSIGEWERLAACWIAGSGREEG